jgi:hypothetical protein
MLPDIERKVLRILYNYSLTHYRMPTIRELETMTGRRKEGLFKTLEELEKKVYIKWEIKPYTQSIVVLEGWDRDQPVAPRTNTISDRSPSDWTQF